MGGKGKREKEGERKVKIIMRNFCMILRCFCLIEKGLVTHMGQFSLILSLNCPIEKLYEKFLFEFPMFL
ncbi:hypothetical protein LJB62_19325, partial [Bacillus sp. DFI.2.34]|nr:hypothetical protein [Bacillus sp. DFI.2.34]